MEKLRKREVTEFIQVGSDGFKSMHSDLYPMILKGLYCLSRDCPWPQVEEKEKYRLKSNVIKHSNSGTKCPKCWEHTKEGTANSGQERSVSGKKQTNIHLGG